jgi:hypothetical protein
MRTTELQTCCWFGLPTKQWVSSVKYHESRVECFDDKSKYYGLHCYHNRFVAVSAVAGVRSNVP